MRGMFPENITLSSRSSVMHVPGFLDWQTADSLTERISDQITFTRPKISMFGKQSLLPREVAWIADNDLRYAYSGISTRPVHWPRFLHPIRQLVEAQAGTSFNSVLVNRYQDGYDSVGWHSDDEPELGPAPIIASLSLGATRRFLLRNKHTKETFRFDLAHGDFLLMLGECQMEFTHSAPRTRKVVAPRVNLTFRNLITPHHVREQTANNSKEKSDRHKPQ